MITIKDSVIKLSGYEVPQQALIKLNQNESPYDIPDEYKKEILKRLYKVNWNRYPAENPEDLKKKIADYTDYPAEGIIVGNGSNELILAIMLATCDKDDNITLIKPGFGIYPYLGKILQLRINETSLKNDFSFDVEKIIRNSNNSKLIMFASPNNPTGTAMDINEIEEVVRTKKCFVVVDEAYYEFHDLTCQRLLDKYQNLLILRTFSKAFGLAGVRLGYLLCNPDVAKQFRKTKLPFSVGIFQMIAGQFLLTKKRFVMETVQKIIAEREMIFNALKSTPEIIPFPSRANFILFKIKNRSSVQLFEALYKKGILVRRFYSRYLNNMLRVTVGTDNENKKFIKMLKEIMKKPGVNYA